MPAWLTGVVALRGRDRRGARRRARSGGGHVRLTDDWLGPPGPAPADPVVELARRHAHAHPPSAPEDFAAWSGLGLRDARRAYEQLELEEVEVLGRTAYVPKGLEPAPPHVRLLPAFDSLLLGHRDRSLILDPEHDKAVRPGGGILAATLVVDGHIEGTWKLKRGRPDVTPFGDPPDYADEVADVERFRTPAGTPRTPRASRRTPRRSSSESLSAARIGGSRFSSPARRLAQLLEPLVGQLLVAALLERLQPLELLALGLGVDAQDLLDLGVLLLVLVDADDDVLLRAVALVVAEGGLLDLALDERDRLDRAAHLVDLLDQPARAVLDLLGQRLDVVGAGERVDGVGGARLVGDDLLRAQRDLGGALARQRQRLVVAVGVQRLRAAADRREALQRDAHDVVGRLLRGQRDAAGLRVEADHLRLRVLGAEAVAHVLRPQLARGAELRDLLEDVVVAVEEEGQAGGEVVDVEPGVDRRLHVGHAVGERERDLLHRRAALLAEVVAGDRDRVPACGTCSAQ